MKLCMVPQGPVLGLSLFNIDLIDLFLECEISLIAMQLIPIPILVKKMP